MVIACCDSRVHIQSIFEADEGELFIHRNIANLVPPYDPDGRAHGTSAAVEYAVTALRVANILVVGHSQWGGVKGCHDMHSGAAPELQESSSFVGSWMTILDPGYEKVRDIEDTEERIRALEFEAVLTSLNNLMTFPFVKEAVENERVSIHGVCNDLRNGELRVYDAETEQFEIA